MVKINNIIITNYISFSYSNAHKQLELTFFFTMLLIINCIKIVINTLICTYTYIIIIYNMQIVGIYRWLHTSCVPKVSEEKGLIRIVTRLIFAHPNIVITPRSIITTVINNWSYTFIKYYFLIPIQVILLFPVYNIISK